MPKKDAQRKSKGKTSKTSSLDNLVAAIEAKRGKQREDYKKAMAALQGLPPIVKAEGWLKFWAQELEDWGDLEAVVYGASRRQIDDAGVRRVLKMWRHAEQKAISRTDLDGGFDSSLAIEEYSQFALRDFWYGGPGILD